MIPFQNEAFHLASAMMRLDTEKSSLEQVIIEHSMICCYGKFLFLEPSLGNVPLRITEHEDKSREKETFHIEGLFLIAVGFCWRGLPGLAIIKEWTLTALPVRFRKEDFLLDSLPYGLGELQKPFAIRVRAGGLVSYQLRILSLQEHVEAEAGIAVKPEGLSPQRIAGQLQV